MPYSVIPWGLYSEIELQELITYCFENAGYKVDNIHKSDPAREKGVDLLGEKEGKIVAIAVKRKPKDADRAQLMDLFEYDADERIYVYSSTPTHPFIEKMRREDVKDAIEFWSKENLGEKLNELDSFIMSEISMCYNVACYQCNGIIQTLIELWKMVEEVSEEQHKKMVADSPRYYRPHRILWNLKDHASALHKFASMQEALFEKLATHDFVLEQQMTILKHTHEMLEKLEHDVVSRMHQELIDFLEIKQENVLRVISATRSRSNWSYMFNFRKITTDFYANRVLETVSELMDRKSVYGKLVNRTKSSKGLQVKQRLSELGESRSRGIGGIAWFFGALKQFAWGFESFVDDIYQSLTENDFDYHFSDWRHSELTEEDFKEMGIEPPPSF